MIKKICSMFIFALIIGNLSMTHAMKPNKENPTLLNYIQNHKYDYVYKANSSPGPGIFSIVDLKSVKIECSNEHETVIHVKTILCANPIRDKYYFEEPTYTRYAYNHDEHNMYIETKDENTGTTNWKYLPPTKGGTYKLEWLKEASSAAAEQVYYIAMGKKFHINSPYDYNYSNGVTNIFP